MKRLLVLTGCTVLLLSGGCQPSNRSKKPMEVIIEQGGPFPSFLVGTWRADTDGWEFVFGPDGTISSAVIALGRVKLIPGQVTTIPMRKGGKGIFEPGQWLVHYDPASRELTLQISLKHFHAELGKDVLEGKCTDIFVGQISKDGKVWPVVWTAFPDYTAHTAKYPNYKLDTDLEYGMSKALIFEKVLP